MFLVWGDPSRVTQFLRPLISWNIRSMSTWVNRNSRFRLLVFTEDEHSCSSLRWGSFRHKIYQEPMKMILWTTELGESLITLKTLSNYHTKRYFEDVVVVYPRTFLCLGNRCQVCIPSPGFWDIELGRGVSLIFAWFQTLDDSVSLLTYS